MAKNNFRPQKFYDYEIVDYKNRVVGQIRIKPSGILWSPRGTHNWLGISLTKFDEFMKEHGRKQKK
ncbi:MAG: hypothetical protein JRJ38_10565 [Deltaproteobacteria bacterium]|nr:hypothetical protein [Deltaproteobacteria bacterium]